MIGTVSFHDFIARIREGDEDAARELVRQFERVIRREVRLRLDDHRLYRVFDSMDISQSVLTSFFARASSGQFDLETPEQLVGLLIQMTRNKLAFQVRRQRARRRDSRMTDARPVDEIDVASPSPGPSELASDHDLIEAVRRRLGEEERRLADLRAEGWEWPEIAARLGGSAQARRIQLARAVHRVARDAEPGGRPGCLTPPPARAAPAARPMARLGGPAVPPALARGAGRPARRRRLPRRRAGARPEEAVAVLRADQRERWRAGEPVAAEWYFERFPGLLADPELALDLIFGEFLLREAAGEAPEVDEYLARFPRFAEPDPAPGRPSTGALDAGRGRPERPRPPPPRPGPRDLPAIPGYEILGELGAGGMGVVYEAVPARPEAAGRPEDGPGRPPATTPSSVARFRKEAEASARLHHPNIAEIHEIGEFDGRPYFSLELVEGGDLAQRARPPGRWPRGGPPSSSRPWPGRCTTPTSAGSSTATSSRPTSC